MPSADLFLRLLEEKDLVSPAVLQAARRHAQEASPPADAVRISLWLVQGQHITATQADRLLSAAAEKTEIAAPKLPLRSALQPQSPARQGPTAAASDDLDLAPIEEEAKGKPVKRAAAPAKTASDDQKSPAPPAKAPNQAKKNPAAKIGDELESLPETMKGPLDALIESEALQSSAFDDPAGLQLNPPVSRKFTLRRFLKNLFRRDKSKTVRIKAADPRQVKLVLISWGAGVAVVLGLLSAFWFFSPGSSDDIRQKGDDAMTAEDYTKAIGFYTEFLNHYAATPDANNVRLSRCVADLRLAEKQATASGDWSPAFEVAKAQVKALPKDHVDSAVVQKFGITLAKIGEGLAHQTQSQPDEASVNRLQAIVEMLETNIPESSRPTLMIEEMQDALRHGRQELGGRQELDQAIDAIAAAVKESNVQAAYTAYRGLVQFYPNLCDDARLAAAMRQVSTIQQKAVQRVARPLTAVHAERPSGLLTAMPLAVQPVKGELTQGRGKIDFAVVQGTAYGLDAAKGKVLWRRFVALDPKLPAATVLKIPDRAASDVVLCDPPHQELLRVEGATGKLLWRLVVGQPIVAGPVRADKWLLLVTKDDRLLVVDVATGDSSCYFQLPQAVRLPPLVDATHGLIVLVAEHSNLIVLDMNQIEKGKCRQVLHVGHAAGTIAAPPLVAGDFLMLPVNDTPKEAAIRVFSISPDRQDGPLAPVQTIRVPGSVAAAPVALGHGAVVVTEQGSLFALDRSEADNRLPFQVVASKPVSLAEKSIHYLFSAGSTFWVADGTLRRYAVQGGQIMQEVIRDLGMEFLQAPVLEGGTMFQVLLRSGMPGAMVSAFDPEKGEPVWRTWLAAPLAAEPALGPVSGKLTAVTASGGVIRGLPDGLMPAGKPWEPILAIDSSRLRKPLVSMLPLAGERFAISSGAETRQIAIYDPKEQDRQFRWLLSPQEMSAAPGAFAGGLLTACVNGQVFLLDPDALGNMAKPMEPVIKNASTWNWTTPMAVDDTLAVVTDGDKRLMAIGISAGDGKALTQAAVAMTKNGLVSPAAVLGKVVFVVARDAADSTDSLLSFELPNLKPGKRQVLGARCGWGPERVGNLVFIATEENRLLAIDERQEVIWQTVLGYGPLAGVPYVAGGEIFLSARGGMIWRISAADGKELGKVDAGCPLGTGPLVVGPRVIIGGHDGSLLEVKRP